MLQGNIGNYATSWAEYCRNATPETALRYASVHAYLNVTALAMIDSLSQDSEIRYRSFSKWPQQLVNIPSVNAELASDESITEQVQMTFEFEARLNNLNAQSVEQGMTDTENDTFDRLLGTMAKG